MRNDNQHNLRDDLLPNPLQDEVVNIYENEEEEDDRKSLQSLTSEEVNHERSYMGMTRSSMLIKTRHTTDALAANAGGLPTLTICSPQLVKSTKPT